MNTFKTIMCYALWLFLFSACENKQKNTTDTPLKDTVATEADPWADVDLEDKSDPFRGLALDKKVDALLDSIDIQWYAWNKRDNERNDNLLALSKEIGKLPKHNKALLDSVKMMYQIALDKKLTQENLLTPNRIDEYDRNMISLVEKIGRLLETTPKNERCKTCKALLEEIRYTDELELGLRKTYDDNVFILNELIEKEKINLEKLGDKYKNMNKLPVFAIMN